MPRKPRLFVSGATYHVYCRVARGEFVFENPDNAEAFIETLRDVSNNSVRGTHKCDLWHPCRNFSQNVVIRCLTD